MMLTFEDESNEIDFEQDQHIQQKMINKIDEFVREAPIETSMDVLKMYKYAHFC